MWQAGVWQPFYPHARPRAKDTWSLTLRSSQIKPLYPNIFKHNGSCSRAISLPGALFPVPTRSRSHITFLRSPEKELGRRASASRAPQRRAAKAVHLGEQRVLGLVDAPSAPPPPGWQKVLGHYYSEISSQRWPTQGWGAEGARLTRLFGKDQKIVSKDSCRGAGN